MSDETVHTTTDIEQQCGKCVVSWQSTEQSCQKKMSVFPHLVELPNATFMVLNLSHIPVSSVGSAIEAGGPEEAKNHKGVRVTFLVLKVMSPGWTWVGAAGSEKDTPSSGGGGSNNKKGGASRTATTSKQQQQAEVKEKLGVLVGGEHAVMYSYDLTNVRGLNYHYHLPFVLFRLTWHIIIIIWGWQAYT